MVDRVFILRYHRCLAQAQPDVVVSNTDGDELGRTSKTVDTRKAENCSKGDIDCHLLSPHPAPPNRK
ncbi:hypothetical protein V490_08045 [Pseudogymnoascus sp. VKM F-3557]|nr:hypothetical protein V490_08045 [Pseudogymnoascus sp. VKM F-3557]